MTTYNTGNPLGSKDPRDLYDNAENLDAAVNTRQAESWDDRFGVARKTWWGMEQDFQQFLINSGYENIGDYAAGLEITARNQIFWRDGELYRAGAVLELPYTTTGDWVAEGDLFVAVGDQALRQELADPANGAAMIAGVGDFSVKDLLSGRSISSGMAYATRFGIVSSPALDQTLAVEELHMIANALGLPVSYAGISEIALDANANINIETDVDFAGCVFHLLNGMKPEPLGYNFNVLFLVTGSATTSLDIDPASLTSSSYKPSLTGGGSVPDGYLHISSDLPVGNRTTSPDEDLFFEQSFQVSGGYFVQPLSVGLTTQAVTAIYRPNDKRITITGFCVNPDSYNNQTLFRIMRNGVSLRCFNKLEPATNFDSINSEISILNCCSTSISEFDAVGNTNSLGTGTYTLNIDRSAEVFFDRVVSLGGNGGTTGTNHINGWYVSNSSLSRIDTHAGMHNIYVDRSTIGEGGVIYGWGGGKISVTNSTKCGGSDIVAPRADYSGSFFGDISIRDVTVICDDSNLPNPSTVSITSFYNTYSDGIETHTCKTLSIQGVNVRYLGSSPSLTVRPITFGPRESEGTINLPESVLVERISTNKPVTYVHNAMLLDSYQNTYGGTRMSVVFRDIKSSPSNSVRFIDMGGGTAHSVPVTAKINIDNCTGIVIRSFVNMNIRISNSEISCLDTFSGGSPNQIGYVSDCVVSGTITSGNVTGGLGAGYQLSNLDVRDNANANAVISMQGVKVRQGVTLTLPAGATISTAILGWVNTSAFIGG